jgi:hypothetical protein
LDTRPRLIAILNTFSKEEIDLVLEHIEYIISQTVANVTVEPSDDNGIDDPK